MVRFFRALVIFGAGVVAAGAFSLILDGVIRDEYQLADSALLGWSWFPFLAGLVMVLAGAVGVSLAKRRAD